MNWRAGVCLYSLLLAAACSASRGERIGSECLTSAECALGTRCEAGWCTSASASVTGKVQGAPEDVRLERRGDDQTTCREHKGELVCVLEGTGRLVLIAPEVAGHRFVAWTGPEPCRGSEHELALRDVARDLVCTAKYVRRLRVTGSVAGEEGLIVLATAEGEHAACEQSRCEVDRGQLVTLTAPERDGYRISGFVGAGCEQQADYTASITPEDHDVVCTASYVESLTVRGEVQGFAAGDPAAEGAQVEASSSFPDALCRGASCAIARGEMVVLRAPTVPGYRFRGWLGHPSCSSADAEVQISAPDTHVLCTADYVRRFTVRGESQGAPAELSASADSAFASCTGPVCEVDEGVSVTLLAGSVRGYRLNSWSGAGCQPGSGSSALASEVTEDRTCVAEFVQGVAVSGTVVHADAVVNASSSSENADCALGRCVIDTGGTVTLEAPSLPGRTFLGWSGDPGCTGSELAITVAAVEESKECRATFAPRYRVEGRPAPSAGGSVVAASTAQDSRCTAGACEVDEGGTVALTASPAPGFRFTGWTGGGACAGGTLRLELPDLHEDLACNANFSARIQVSGEALPAGAGSVGASSLSLAAACSGAACTVDAGSNVLLTARANPGWTFARWTGCGSPLNPLLLTNPLLVAGPSAAVHCTANFQRVTYTATAQAWAGGQASVRVGDCSGARCSVEHDGSATFSARPDTGYQLTAWSGSCAGSQADYTLTPVRGNATCTAQFGPIPITVTGAADLADAGSVTARSTSAGAACSGARCTVSYGSSVTLEATQNAGYRLTGWSCGGTGTSITLTNVTSDQLCTANYERITYQVTSQVLPPGAGSVSCSTSDCRVAHGDGLTLVAQSQGGYRFVRWTGDCTSSGPSASLTDITSGRACTAEFIRQVTVSVRVGRGAGSVSCGGGATRCTVDVGSSVPIRAVNAPYSDEYFSDWSECSPRAPRSAETSVDNVGADVTCTANFDPGLLL